MTIEIRKNVPLPGIVKRGGGARPRVYPLHLMQVGDSIIAPVPAGKTVARHASNVSAVARGHSIRHGGKFATRKLPDGSIGVWRIA